KTTQIMLEALIIGSDAACLSCAVVLGSAKEKPFAKNKRIGIITHQKTSHLQTALFNNVLGLNPGTTGASILKQGRKQLAALYPHVDQIEKEKATEIVSLAEGFQVLTNKNTYTSKIVVIAVGYTNLMTIKGLNAYIEPDRKSVV